ncbi:hypothetical protein SLEP1_g1865 [Rubroshorea leprosula]|uniref:FAD dependent oxidoreductase domain-containing protein n=1 Tax=Rubroshorea leprosula TaxID=152421 RepID=A0AAV5HF83_9ROSI|nr:hypothetical protein SLEP1_g1865 [Rubroshorea leprosula]
MGSFSDEYDVIIVGGGVMGSSAAHQLAKRGQKTLLLEQFDFLHHRGSSHGESRTICPTYPADYYYPMVMESYQLWGQAQAEIGYKVLFNAPHLDIYRDYDKRLRETISTWKKNGATYEILHDELVKDKFSGRIDIPEDWIGLFTEDGGVIKPTKAVSMFQTLAYKYGAVLRDNTEVLNIEKDEVKGVVVTTTKGEKFCGKRCVVTAGAWTSKLVKTVSGIELPIQPLETCALYWRIKEGHEAKFSIEGDFPTFASYGVPYVYGTPCLEYPGLIKVAVHGGDPCDPDKRPWKPGHMMDSLKQWIERTFKGMVDSSGPVATQLCMYSWTPDEDFIIDFLGGGFGKDVVVAGGFSGHGFKMSPIIGRILADLVLTGEAEGVEMKYFRIARFEENPKGNFKDFMH